MLQTSDTLDGTSRLRIGMGTLINQTKLAIRAASAAVADGLTKCLLAGRGDLLADGGDLLADYDEIAEDLLETFAAQLIV